MQLAHITAAIVFFCSISAIRAHEKMPNTLSPKEIADGWILLFDGATTYGWKVDGEARVEHGSLLLGGKSPGTVTSTSTFPPSEIHYESRPNGAKVFETKTLKTNGGEPIKLAAPENAVLELRSITLRPLETKPLFNGKDLDSWKVFNDPKRNRSKWTVTKEGWLNVKNGPGDLQAHGKYADFLLQLECISNGKWLNSGIFFRCIDNEYQNGYEMQIQNGYIGDNRAKPIDFGTGAIYRRVPARKVVPNDNEWFGMTLLARGKHFATWVNGYQTVDWVDDRKEDANPRKGAKTAAGHISIQGHDVTTDLSFRDIRIVEIAAPKK